MQKHIQIKEKLVMTKNSEKSIKGKNITDTHSLRSTHNTWTGWSCPCIDKGPVLGTSPRVAKWKLHSLMMLEYCYWWKESWLLEKRSQHSNPRVLFLIFLRCRFQGEGQGKKHTIILLCVTSILFFKFMWIDEMQILNESRIVQWW